MDLIMKQMPVVVSALNVGFLQTLKLFIVTLVGALPLGLVIAFGSMSHFKPLSWLARLIVWVIRGTPLMIQLLIIYYFPGLVLHNPIWVVVKQGASFAAGRTSFIINYRLSNFQKSTAVESRVVPEGQKEAGLVLGMTKHQIFFKITLLQMIKRIVPPMSNEIITLVKDTSLARIIALAGDHLGRTGIYERLTWHLRCHLAAVLYRCLLSYFQWYPDRSSRTP